MPWVEPGSKEWTAAGLPEPGSKEWSALVDKAWDEMVAFYDAHGWPVTEKQKDIFCYSVEEWDAVRAELPGHMTEHYWRYCLESRARDLITTSQFKTGELTLKRARGWRQVARLAEELEYRLSLQTLRFGELDDYFPEDFQENLIKLAELANLEAEDSEHRAKTRRKASNATDRARDRFLKELLRLWRMAGGELKISRRASDGRADGPLIRFLLAVAKPALAATERGITEEALRHFVRKARNGAS